MLAIISPAKKLDITLSVDNVEYTQPDFLDKSQELIKILKGMNFSEVKDLMKLSDNLTQLNFERFHDYSAPFDLNNAKRALDMFKGDTYVGLEAENFSNDEMSYAQDHLRILSGLYGVLRPLDLMQAYRLEMGTALNNEQGNNLYNFWGDLITNACNDAVKSHSDKTIVCLASNEYSKAISKENLASNFLTCHFKEYNDGNPKVIGLFAKRARGMMAKFMIKDRIEQVEGLKDFNKHGYKFDEDLSTRSDFVFVR